MTHLLRNTLLVGALLGLVLVARGGFQPDEYEIYVMGVTTPQPYPIQGVALFGGFVLIECLALFLIVGKLSFLGLPIRLFLALVVFVAWIVLLGMSSMHQPPYFFGHLLWVAIVVVSLVAALVSSIAVSLFRRVSST
jgi:hypothetical protein